MGLVKPVFRELRHQVKQVTCLLFIHPARSRTLHKEIFVFGHFVGLFLPHRTPEHIGLAERIACHIPRDLHHLLLIENHAISVLQDRLKLGEFVSGFQSSVLSVDEIIHHAGPKWTRTIKGVDRGDVLETVRNDPPAKVLHAVRFHLKYAIRVSA